MENMDVISETVWLTRQDNQGIYNAYYQESYSAEGPLGTQWRWGSTLDDSYSEVGYGTLQEAIISTGYNTNQLLVQQVASAPIFSLYLPESNEYYDVTFLTFGGNNSGGSFSWERNRVEMNEIYPG